MVTVHTEVERKYVADDGVELPPLTDLVAGTDDGRNGQVVPVVEGEAAPGIARAYMSLVEHDHPFPRGRVGEPAASGHHEDRGKDTRASHRPKVRRKSALPSTARAASARENAAPRPKKKARLAGLSNSGGRI